MDNSAPNQNLGFPIPPSIDTAQSSPGIPSQTPQGTQSVSAGFTMNTQMPQAFSAMQQNQNSQASQQPQNPPVTQNVSQNPAPQPVQTQPVQTASTIPAPQMPTFTPPAQPQNPPAAPTFSVTNASDLQITSESGDLTIYQMLEMVAQRNASDLHLVVGYPAMLRIDGDLVAISQKIVTPEIAKNLIYEVLPDDKKEQLEVNREVDLAYGYEGVGRFRINAYFQRGYLSAAFRLIPTRIRTLDELKMPAIFTEFANLEQGLVLVTGPTGHGKSTTLAAIIQKINDTHPKHILTIEDPVEYVFPQSKALVSQRELGDDTHSWKGALRAALREDPDVVLVGEMRDYETVNSAITVAETGHLVLATLHTNNAAQTIQRIINVFPDVQQEEVRTQLADILQVVVAQRLIPIKGGGRRAAVEIMLMTPAIRNLIRENKVHQIDNVIRTSLDIGMITLERSLLNLFKEGLISQEDALRYALDSSEMQRLIQELR
jgi:twitching motility protein PilT